MDLRCLVIVFILRFSRDDFPSISKGGITGPGFRPGAFFTYQVLLEFEVGEMQRAIVQLDNQLAAGAFPFLAGLPDVVVLI